MKPVFILNGPNLNMLGSREQAVYGSETLADLETRCVARAKALGLSTEFRQSNVEGELVGWIQAARTEACGIVLNAAAYTHTSIALHDALKAADVPVIEVHLSNIYRREPFRQVNYLADIALESIVGQGARGYHLALESIARRYGGARG